MTTVEFNKLVSDRCEKIVSILSSKAEEYARGDRLSNFKRAAAALECTSERACIGMWMKHIVSVLDMVDDIERGRGWSMQKWEEKIGDAINYLILLEGLVRERVYPTIETGDFESIPEHHIVLKKKRKR